MSRAEQSLGVQALVRREAQASECLVSILAVFSDILTIPDTK